MKPSDLIAVARKLVASGNGKPSQAILRRSVSTTYYALFHTLARCGADLLVGGSGARRSEEAWRQVYRGLEHRRAKDACSKGQILRKFPKPVEDFGNLFAQMQEKRHKADYDPHAKFAKSSVCLDIDLTEKVMADFEAVAKSDKRAFAAYVLFKLRI